MLGGNLGSLLYGDVSVMYIKVAKFTICNLYNLKRNTGGCEPRIEGIAQLKKRGLGCEGGVGRM